MKKKLSRSVENLKFNNELVIQHNHLIESRYRLNLQEKRLMMFLISQIKKNDPTFNTVIINILELANLIGLEGQSIYREMEKTTNRMIGRVLSVRNLDENWLLQVPWVASARYLYKEGLIRIRIADELAPFLLQLQGEFTVTRLSDLMKFKSIYAIRIYELLKQYESIGSRKMDISELRLSCGIPENRLKSISDFRIKVLEISKREINEKSDIFIDFEFIKRSREFVAIEFSIKKNPNYGKISEEIETETKFKQISLELKTRDKIIEDIVYHFGFTTNKVTLMIEQLSDIEVEEALKAVKNQLEKGQVKSPKAMIRTAFKEKWKPDVFNPGKLKKVS
jgi:plasmid replication initiation protein